MLQSMRRTREARSPTAGPFQPGCYFPSPRYYGHDPDRFESVRLVSESTNLDSAIAQYVGSGWRVESRSDRQAVLVKGHRPNHLLHLVLSIITLGIWIPVWVGVTLFAGEKRRVVSVSP